MSISLASRACRLIGVGEVGFPPPPQIPFIYPVDVRPTPFVFLLCAACAEPATPARAPVVYGEDGRTEVFAETNAALRAVAETAIAMKVRARFVDESDPTEVVFDYARTLGEAHTLCDGERFADQIDPGTCSGTLIDAQHVLTAGHCMDTAADCDDYAWVLGFRYAADGALATLTSDDVYRCGQVVTLFDDDQVDYAVVRLARPVVGHTPATLRREVGALAHLTPVALIGHPHGIPMKIDPGGALTWSSADASWFRATVDAFAGNSGSGTFTLDGTMVGILGGGATDYTDAGGCNVVNVIEPPPTDSGERLTYVRPALDAFCAVPGVVSPLCDCGGAPCVEGPAHDRCENAEVIAAESQVIEDTLEGYAPWTVGSCGGNGADRVYTFTLTESAAIEATVEGFDSVLYLREATCEGDELACNDDIDPDTNRGSTIRAGLLPGTYFLFVDGYGSEVGAYTLTVTFVPRAVDAGPPPEPDAGPPPMVDAGDDGIDAGLPDPGAPAPMGGCRVAPRGERGVPLVALLAVLAGLRRRRRRPSGNRA
ncbi:MAG: trypsin-like peptidase domain-containing protein [Myxococcales bacterium]|nr:trypsin-like peptidase domain-containing protein [Myxococcales bacterium]